MLREILQLGFLLLPLAVEPHLHLLVHLVQIVRSFAHETRQRHHLHVQMALHGNTLRLTETSHRTFQKVLSKEGKETSTCRS